MASELPEYYFRMRENGALVFRLDTENRQRRIEMDQIAAVNVKNGEVKPHGDHVLDDADTTAISAWMDARRETLAGRTLDEMHRTVETLNLTTHWINSRASDDEIAEITEPLLMAMHDLRSTLVRKKANGSKD